MLPTTMLYLTTSLVFPDLLIQTSVISQDNGVSTATSRAMEFVISCSTDGLDWEYSKEADAETAMMKIDGRSLSFKPIQCRLA